MTQSLYFAWLYGVCCMRNDFIILEWFRQCGILFLHFISILSEVKSGQM